MQRRRAEEFANRAEQRESRIRRDRISVHSPRIVRRHIHNLRTRGRQLDHTLVVTHNFLRRTLQRSSGLRASAHHLDRFHHILRLVVVRIAQVRRPLQVAIHLRQNLREGGQRLYAGIPGLHVGGLSKLLLVSVALRLPPPVRFHHWWRISQRGKYLRDQAVGVERNRCHQLLKLPCIKRLARS